jgi:hypothetical protein
MSSLSAARCQHIKTVGTQCGSPALRNKKYCFYHQEYRPIPVECYSEGQYATGEIDLPFFEDAHSIQNVLRQVVQMVMQKRIERRTASLLLYALQIASSNLKRMELEKPQPEQVVSDLETVAQTPIEPTTQEPKANGNNKNNDENSDNLPPGTIQASYRPGPKTESRQRPRKKQYVI